jgi:hypothetical protein
MQCQGRKFLVQKCSVLAVMSHASPAVELGTGWSQTRIWFSSPTRARALPPVQPARRQDWYWPTWAPPVTSAVSSERQPPGGVPVVTCPQLRRPPRMEASGTVERALMMTFSGSIPCTGEPGTVCAFQSAGMQYSGLLLPPTYWQLRLPSRAVSSAEVSAPSSEKYADAPGASPPAKSTSAESGSDGSVTNDVPGPS